MGFLRTVLICVICPDEEPVSDHGIDILFFFFQVAASKTKIYMVLEYVNGGELFDKIVRYASLVGAVAFSCKNCSYLVNTDIFFPLLIFEGRKRKTL